MEIISMVNSKNSNEKIFLITGASSGLGYAVAERGAKLGYHMVLLCRNREKGENVVQEIQKANPESSIDLMICDLSSMNSMQRFTDEFKSKYSKLNILYNNAAVMKRQRIITEDSFEMMFQVNYLASFVFMNAFIDLLKNSEAPLIINNGRPSYKLRLDLEDLQFSKNYSMYQSFFKTKLCLIFATIEFSRKYSDLGIPVTMIDPGPFKSDLVREMPLMGLIKNLFSASLDKAAENILYHITSDQFKSKNGKVFREKQEWPLTDYWMDEKISKHLWNMTESLLKDK